MRDSGDVVQTERPRPEVDLLVASAELAAERAWSRAARCWPSREDPGSVGVVVVAGPFGKGLVLVDLSKGRYQTGHPERGDRGER